MLQYADINGNCRAGRDYLRNSCLTFQHLLNIIAAIGMSNPGTKRFNSGGILQKKHPADQELRILEEEKQFMWDRHITRKNLKVSSINDLHVFYKYSLVLSS